MLRGYKYQQRGPGVGHLTDTFVRIALKQQVFARILRCVHQQAITGTAVIAHSARLRPIVPRGRDLVYLTAALIAMCSLAALRHAVQAEIEGDSRIRAKPRHQILPCMAMRLGGAPRIHFVYHVMRYFMRDGIAHILGEILGKNPRVIAYDTVLADDFEHARRASLEIKKHRYAIKSPRENSLRQRQVLLGSLLYLPLLCKPDRLHEGSGFTPFHSRDLLPAAGVQPINVHRQPAASWRAGNCAANRKR